VESDGARKKVSGILRICVRCCRSALEDLQTFGPPPEGPTGCNDGPRGAQVGTVPGQATCRSSGLSVFNFEILHKNPRTWRRRDRLRAPRLLGARPRKIASLYVGRRDGERVLYAGKAGTGYTETVARELREKLDPLIIKKSPLAVAVKKPKPTWVRPVVNAEIEYGALPDDGPLCEAVFKGLRDDLVAPAVQAPSIATDLQGGIRKGAAVFRARTSPRVRSVQSISGSSGRGAPCSSRVRP
jgi:hypothetical protein